MGWTIEHLAGRTPTRTYGWMDEVMGLVWHETTPDERPALALIYRETTQSGDGHMSLPPQDARAAAEALRSVRRRLPQARGATRDHLLTVDQLVTAAETAARSGRDWHWT